MNPVFTDPIASQLGNWAADITIGSILLRLLLSLVLGAIIGWERSNKRHSAGLRTFMLAFLIGTLAALLDSYVFADSGKSSLFLLSGATIIGASVIAVHSVFYSSRNQIKGLTTAVGLWVALYRRPGLLCRAPVRTSLVPRPGNRIQKPFQSL